MINDISKIKSKYANKRTDQEKIDIVRKYLEGQSSCKLAEEYKCKPSSIFRILKYRNVEIRTQSKAHQKYSIDEGFFDKIDTEDKAYFLGLLYADGYNNVNKTCVVLQLQEKDKEIIVALQQRLQPNKPLQYIKREHHKKKASNAWRISISNKHISEQLEHYGCGNKKSFRLRMPNLRDDLIRHFVRGYFDGDGSITFREGGSSLFSIIGNIEFIQELQKILIKNCNVKQTKLDVYKKTGGRIASVRYCGHQQLIRIRDFMYCGAKIFLTRKKRIFMEL